MEKISESIRAYRKKHNLSQSEFANRLHVTKQAVSKWETGRGYPDSALIPVIAKELGISIDSLMGEKPNRKGLYILLSIVTLLIVSLVLFIPMIVNYYQEVQEFNEFKTEIEDILELELPNKGTLVNVDFEDWIVFGNTIPISQMTYLVFKDGSKIDSFESNLVNDLGWRTSLDDNLLKLLPVNILDYSTIGDYYTIYNVDMDTFNESTINTGTYHIMFMIYQNDNNRLIVFDYSINIEGGN